MSFDLDALPVPLVAAPMAGASTPELVAAVSAAGGFGFLAAGYQSVAVMVDQIARTRSLVDAPFGVNLFTPQRERSAELADELTEYARLLAPYAARVGVEVGAPRYDDDQFAAKVEALVADPVPVVTLTFGAVPADAVARLRRAGSLVGFTVTDPSEARLAEGLGADLLVVQGADAGGHRGTWSVSAEPNAMTAVEAVRRIRPVTELPIIGSGGVAGAAEVTELLRAGSQAVAVGTLFVAADESAASDAHKEALTADRYRRAVVARTFSGRYARGLANELMLAGEAAAPAAYPDVHYMTSPIRKAAAAQGDPSLLALWAGAGHRSAVRRPAARILAELAAGAAEQQD